MNGRLISVVFSVERSHFAFSAASLSRCSAIESCAQIGALALLELGEHVIDDAPIEVLAAEEGVAGRREHLDDALAELEDRDVERAAAQVVDGDLLLGRFARGRRRAPRPSAR